MKRRTGSFSVWFSRRLWRLLILPTSPHFTRPLLAFWLAVMLALAPVFPALNPLRPFGALGLRADEQIWTGAGGTGVWSDPANWEDGTIPGEGDVAVFDHSTEENVTVDVDVRVAGFDIKDSYVGQVDVQPGIVVKVGQDGFTQSGGRFVGRDGEVEVAGSFMVAGGDFVASAGTLRVKGHFTVLSEPFFHHNAGTVVLDGFGQTVFGSATFHTFTKKAKVGQEIIFQAGKHLVFDGKLTLTGAASTPGGEVSENVLNVRTSKAGEPVILEPRGAIEASYLAVQDVVNAGTTDIVCAVGCTNAGNVSGWQWPVAVDLPLPSSSPTLEPSVSSSVSPVTSPAVAGVQVTAKNTPDFAADEPVRFSIEVDAVAQTVALTPVDVAEEAMLPEVDASSISPEVPMGTGGGVLVPLKRAFDFLSVVPRHTSQLLAFVGPSFISRILKEGDVCEQHDNHCQRKGDDYLGINAINVDHARVLLGVAADTSETIPRGAVARQARLSLMPSLYTRLTGSVGEWSTKLVKVAQAAEFEVVEPVAAELLAATLTDPAGQPTALVPVIEGTDKTLTLVVPKPTGSFRPGKYHLTATITGTGLPEEGVVVEQDFTWGVLAMNSHQDVYVPGQTAELGFGVLSDAGSTVCDAELELTVISPTGQLQMLSTTAGTITRNATCGQQQADLIAPDYAVDVPLPEAGTWQLALSARIEAGQRTMVMTLPVEAEPALVVTRRAATRLWPFAPSPVTIEVLFREAFSGQVVEHVPASFVVTGLTPEAINTLDDSGEERTLAWSGSWAAGEVATFSYTYDAPDESPHFYLLGPMKLMHEEGSVLLTERRTWQVAADADVTVDSSVYASLSNGYLPATRGMDGPYWTSATTGYIVYLDSGQTIVYSKTTDGGANWAAATTISSDTAESLATWFDKNTSGDTGTKIHVAWTDGATAQYRSLDTNNDSLGTETTVATGVTASGQQVAIAKARGGNLYMQYVHYYGSAGDHDFYRSTDGGVNWTNRADGYENGDTDFFWLFPGNESDSQDMWMTYWDISANEVSLKVYDDSADSWSETSISTGMTESLVGVIGANNWGGAIRHSDNHLILAVWNNHLSATGDLTTWDIASTASITQKTDVLTNQQFGAYGDVFIDQNTDTIYVTYVRSLVSSMDTVNVYYTASTDGGANWGSETTMNEGSAAAFRIPKAGRSVGSAGGFFQPAWVNDTADDIFVSTTNDVVLTPVISVAGSCKDYDQSTNCPDSQTVKVAVNGTLSGQSTTTSSGAFSISSVGVSSGDVVTVFLDGVTDANEAVAVTKYDGSGNISGVLLYEEHLTIGSADNQTLSNTNLSQYDNSVSTDEDVFFDVDSSVLYVDDTAQSTQEELYILASNTFTPGNNVVTHDIEIDGTFVPEANLVEVQGSWDNDATFTKGTSTVLFTSTADETIDSTGAATASFNDLIVNDGLIGYWKLDETAAGGCTGSLDACDASGYGSHGTWGTTANSSDASDPTSSASAASLNFTNARALDFDGTNDYVSVADVSRLDVGDTADLTISGWFNRGTATTDDTIIAKRNGIAGSDTGYIVYLDDSTDQLIFELSDGTDEYSLTSVSTFTGTGYNHFAVVWDQDSAANSEIYINGVDDNATDAGTIGNIGDTSNAVTLRFGAESDDGNPFDDKLDDIRLYNRALSEQEANSLAVGNQPATEHTAASEITLESTLDVDGDLVLNAGDLDTKSSESNSITVAGEWHNNGGKFTPQTGTVTFDGTTSSQELQSGGQNFYNVTVSGSGGWMLHDRLEVDSIYAQSAGTVDTDSTNNYKVVAGDFDQTAGTFTANSGTVTLNSTSNQTVSFDDSQYDLQVEDMTENGLTGYWKFDEGQGSTTKDWSGNASTGTLTNAPKWSETVNSTTTFDNPYSLDFDGSDDYVSVADVATLDVTDTADLTLTGWFNRDTFTTDDTVIAKRNGIAGSDTGYIAYIDDSTDQLIFEISDGTDEYSLTSASTFTATGWKHFTIVWDQDSAANSEIYINGTDDNATDSGTIANIGDASNAVVLGIASESDAANYFDGKLDDMRVYKRTVETTEVTSLAGGKYANGDADDGLVGYWKLDESSGGTLGDFSGWANTGSGSGSGGANGSGPAATTTKPSTPLFYNPYARDFDGTDDRVAIADADSLDMGTSDDYTVSGWLKHPSTASTRGVVNKRDHAAGTNDGFQLQLESGNALHVYFSDGSANRITWNSSSAFADDTWHHFTVTFDRDGNGVIYRDGTSAGSTAISGQAGDASNSRSLYIGATENSGGGGLTSFFDGQIDDVRAYKRLLTGTEITNLATNGETGNATFTLATALDINNDLLLQRGTLDVSSSNYAVTVGGDWHNFGGSDTYIRRSGTVTLDGTTQAVNGPTAWYNLTKTESTNNSTDETVTFEKAIVFVVTNLLTFDGRDDDDRINLLSSTNGTKFTLDVVGGQQIERWLDVKDSQASSFNITCVQCANSGGNDDAEAAPHWIFNSGLGRNRIVNILTE